MSRASLACQVQTTRRYVAKDGKVRFAGTAQLKGTQFLRFKTGNDSTGVSWDALLKIQVGVAIEHIPQSDAIQRFVIKVSAKGNQIKTTS